MFQMKVLHVIIFLRNIYEWNRKSQENRLASV